MASAPQEFSKFDASQSVSTSAVEPGRAGNIFSRLQHGRAKWMGLLSVLLVLLSFVGLFQKPHQDAYRVVHAAGFDSRGQFSTAGLTQWFLYPSERHAFLRLPAISKRVNDVCVAPNSNSIWIVGDQGLILHSADDGVSWVEQTLQVANIAPQNYLDMGRDISPPPQTELDQLLNQALPDMPNEMPSITSNQMPNQAPNRAPNQMQDNFQQQQQQIQRPRDNDAQLKESVPEKSKPPTSAPKKLSGLAPRETSERSFNNSLHSLLSQHEISATLIAARPPENKDFRPTSNPNQMNAGPATKQSDINVEKLQPPPVSMTSGDAAKVRNPVPPTPAELSNAPKKYDLTAVSFFDDKNGWLIADVENDRLGGSSVAFFHTTDAGKKWQQIAARSILRNYLKTTKIADDSSGHGRPWRFTDETQGEEYKGAGNNLACPR